MTFSISDFKISSPTPPPHPTCHHLSCLLLGTHISCMLCLVSSGADSLGPDWSVITLGPLICWILAQYTHVGNSIPACLLRKHNRTFPFSPPTKIESRSSCHGIFLFPASHNYLNRTAFCWSGFLEMSIVQHDVIGIQIGLEEWKYQKQNLHWR